MIIRITRLLGGKILELKRKSILSTSIGKKTNYKKFSFFLNSPGKCSSVNQ